MNKATSIFILLLATSIAAFGFFTSDFRGWADLIKNSSEIVIAKCLPVSNAAPSTKRLIISDGVIRSDIKVIDVLKGNTKPGFSHLASLYWPYPDQQFVILGNYRSDNNFTGYNAIEGYKIVPLSRDFPLSTLNGKPLTEQMQLIFSNRLSNLTDEINQDEKDKASLEKYLKGQ